MNTASAACVVKAGTATRCQGALLPDTLNVRDGVRAERLLTRARGVSARHTDLEESPSPLRTWGFALTLKGHALDLIERSTEAPDLIATDPPYAFGGTARARHQRDGRRCCGKRP
jgi:hypothetical protein